ncbi:MAG: thermonuclease family protein, partial [Alphaproteobacteria bacterium]
FGDNWRTDFTASVAPRDRRLFEREGHDLMALEGRSVRVRGWVKLRNGPMIEITHPEQIEVLAR